MWFAIFGAIALLAAAGLVVWALWMWRKITALGAAASELAGRAEELAGLVEQVRIPEFADPVSEPVRGQRFDVHVDPDRVG